MPGNCTVFNLPRRLTLSAIYGFDSHSHNWPTVLVRKVKRKPRNFEESCVAHCVLLLKHLSTHMYFITKGYKRFAYTNSSDPRQRVPLNICHGYTRYYFPNISDPV